MAEEGSIVCTQLPHQRRSLNEISGGPVSWWKAHPIIVLIYLYTSIHIRLYIFIYLSVTFEQSNRQAPRWWAHAIYIDTFNFCVLLDSTASCVTYACDIQRCHCHHHKICVFVVVVVGQKSIFPTFLLRLMAVWLVCYALCVCVRAWSEMTVLFSISKPIFNYGPTVPMSPKTRNNNLNESGCAAQQSTRKWRTILQQSSCKFSVWSTVYTWASVAIPRLTISVRSKFAHERN